MAAVGLRAGRVEAVGPVAPGEVVAGRPAAGGGGGGGRPTGGGGGGGGRPIGRPGGGGNGWPTGTGAGAGGGTAPGGAGGFWPCTGLTAGAAVVGAGRGLGVPGLRGALWPDDEEVPVCCCRAGGDGRGVVVVGTEMSGRFRRSSGISGGGTGVWPLMSRDPLALPTSVAQPPLPSVAPMLQET